MRRRSSISRIADAENDSQSLEVPSSAATSGSSLTKDKGSARWGVQKGSAWMRASHLLSSFLFSSLPSLSLLWYFYLNITITGPKHFIMQINSNHFRHL